MAVEFNFNQSNSTGLDTDGGIGTPTNILSGVSLASSQPVAIDLSYNGSTLTETLTQSSNTFSTVYATGNLQTVLGGPAALIGFTGSDGGGSSTQTISSFSFANSPATVPKASTTVSSGLLLALGLSGVVLAKKKASAA